MSINNEPTSITERHENEQKWFYFRLVLLFCVCCFVGYFAALDGPDDLDKLRRQNDSLTVVLQQREAVVNQLQLAADSARVELTRRKTKSDSIGRRMDSLTVLRHDIAKVVSAISDSGLTRRLDTLLGGR